MPTETVGAASTGLIARAPSEPAAARGPSGPVNTFTVVSLVLFSMLAIAMMAAGHALVGAVAVLLPWIAFIFRPLLRLLPTSKIGWFYLATIVGLTVAPSLGALGSVLRFLLAGCMGAVALSVYVSRHRGEPEKDIPRSFALLTGVLIIVLLASALAAPSLSFGLTRFVNWVMFIPAAFLVAVRTDWRGLGCGVVVAAVVQMGGIGLQLLGVIGGTWGGLLTSGTTYNPAAQNWLTRYTSFILDPNNLAVILVLAIVVCLAGIFNSPSSRGWGVTAGLLLLIPTFTFGVILTGSRGGLLCLVIAVSVFALRLRGRALILLSAVAVLMAVIASSTDWDAVSLLVSSLGNIWDGTDRSAGIRLGVWQTYLDQFDWFNYLVGQGFGGYFDGSLSDQSDAGGAADVLRRATVDNAWLKLLLESGLLGCSLVLALVVVTARSAWGNRGSRDLYSAVTLAALSALVFRSLSVDALDINPWNAIVWMTFGACLAIRVIPVTPLMGEQLPKCHDRRERLTHSAVHLKEMN